MIGRPRAPRTRAWATPTLAFALAACAAAPEEIAEAERDLEEELATLGRATLRDSFVTRIESGLAFERSPPDPGVLALSIVLSLGLGWIVWGAAKALTSARRWVLRGVVVVGAAVASISQLVATRVHLDVARAEVARDVQLLGVAWGERWPSRGLACRVSAFTIDRPDGTPSIEGWDVEVTPGPRPGQSPPAWWVARARSEATARALCRVILARAPGGVGG